MNPIYFKLAETLAVLLLYFAIRYFLFKVIHRAFMERSLQESREILIKRVLQIILLLVCLSILFFIWGVNQGELAVIVGSVLTLLGVAFFAQWSILSNITASIILFFKHPAKIGDRIALMEGKDYILEGTIENIGVFFTTIKSSDGGELTLPNNIFLSKTVKRITSSEASAELP
ncbi:MAG: mechanosensitive ion channel domain-containing protein [Nonlabens sp.]